MKQLLFGFMAVSALFFSSCKDKCKDVDCKNNGVCNEGVCECPAGFSGDDCSGLVTPTKVTITQIDIIDFPGTDGGSNWDVVIDTDPDIYLELIDDGTSNVAWTSSTFDNVADGTQFSINGLSIEITNVSDSYSIKMWDDDATSGDDLMTTAGFTPFNGISFPASFTITDGSLEIGYRLHVTYQW